MNSLWVLPPVVCCMLSILSIYFIMLLMKNPTVLIRSLLLGAMIIAYRRWVEGGMA